MKINRKFTNENAQNILDQIEVKKANSTIRDPDGTIVFEMQDIIVPKGWSQTAIDVLAQKYFRKAGIPSLTTKIEEEGIPEKFRRSEEAETSISSGETDARQVFHRLAGCWTYWGFKGGYFDTEKDGQRYYDEMVYILANQMGAPNSPQWFNTGLNWAYGITGPSQGHYYVDPSTGHINKSIDAYTRPQPHACFIQSVNDDLVNDGGILSLWDRETRLFKYGSGTGTNFSNLRGKDEPLSGGGKSSGLMSFLKVGDANAGAIKSGGTTRRAAKMVVLNIDHPEIEEFILWKVIEEQKVAALVSGSATNSHFINEIIKHSAEDNEKELYHTIKAATAAHVPNNYIDRAKMLGSMGITSIDIPIYTTNWQGDAYATVSGQNSNNSIRVTDEFMQSVQEDREWPLYYRTELKNAKVENRKPVAFKTVKAKDLFDKICYAAWASADPGLQFHDSYNDWHTCPAGGDINATNPCSEYAFLDDTACNLASMNLIKFYNQKKGIFQTSNFLHATKLWTLTLEISVLMAQFPSKEIAKRSFGYRTLGLGYANLGTLLMTMGISYDSNEGLEWCSYITALMHLQAYNTSALIAKDIGPFVEYEANKDAMLRVINNHIAISSLEDTSGVSNGPMGCTYSTEKMDDIKAIINDLNKNMQYGFRNAQVTVIAPTGTIGLVMDCDTTGIEPDYALVKYKSLAGGGYFKIINQSVPIALKKLGYTKEQIEEIQAYIIGHNDIPPDISLEDKDWDKLSEVIPNAYDLKMAFKQAKIDMPKEIKDNYEEINEYAYGTMTIEGAPFLKEEHYAVFDCANKCGSKGTRFISSRAHLKMMSAAQAFISGSISKTINMPHDTTIQDIRETYFKAWELGIKAVALYRDGSKLSQPLNTNILDEIDFVEEEVKEQKVKEEIIRYVTGRKPLPGKRAGYTQKAKINNADTIYIRTGEYPDGQLGEVFVDMHREGAAFKGMLSCFAIAVSLGLQHGVPLEEYVEAFTFTKFEPSGMVVGHDRIKMATSIIDYIFRDLAINYLNMNQLSHVKEEPKPQEDTPEHITKIELDVPEGNTSVDDKQYKESRKRGYTGNVCSNCNNATMVRNGTCEKCMTCGETTGCS